VSVSDDEFETMRARARVHRIRLAELGPMSEPVILENVRDRLDLRPIEALPPAQGELADEIFALLKDPRLNTMQVRALEREFFGA
jgi:hypothetical protein